MSEFRCRNGHLLKAGELVCGKCGNRLYTVDGLTERQFRIKDKCEEAMDMQEDEE